MSKDLIYLAAPYSASTQAETEERVKKVLRIDSMLLKLGFFTVSPIYKHFVLPYGDLPSDWEYWKAYSEALLKTCKMLLIIKLPGWETSTGVKGEIEIALREGIEICYINEDGSME